jgi:hypothetical protein
MDTNTMIVLVVALFVILVVVGFLLYRRKARVGIETPAGKLNFEGDNTSSPARASSSKGGIFGNRFWGKTRIEVKGAYMQPIHDNVTVGDTEITTDTTPTPPAHKPRPKRR